MTRSTAPTTTTPAGRAGRGRTALAAAACVAVAATAAACGFSTADSGSSAAAPQPPASTTPPDPGAASADIAAAASQEYISAYNTLINTANGLVSSENSTDPSTQAAALEAEVSARQTFDSAMEGIVWPASAQADAKTVIADDAAVENALGTMAANTSDVSNYNDAFDQDQTAVQTWSTAVAALNVDMGTQITSSTPSAG